MKGEENFLECLKAFSNKTIFFNQSRISSSVDLSLTVGATSGWEQTGVLYNVR